MLFPLFWARRVKGNIPANFYIIFFSFALRIELVIP